MEYFAGSGVRIRRMGDLDLRRILELRSVVRWAADPDAFDLLRGMRDARWAVAEAPDGTLAGMCRRRATREDRDPLPPRSPRRLPQDRSRRPALLLGNPVSALPRRAGNPAPLDPAGRGAVPLFRFQAGGGAHRLPSGGGAENHAQIGRAHV